MHRGAFAEAEPLRRRVLDARERRWGPEHRLTLPAVNNMASVLYSLGKLSEAPLGCAAKRTGRLGCNGFKGNKLIFQTI